MSRAAFFFGSGISYASGAPSVGAITDRLLNGAWWLHTDGRFYPRPADQRQVSVGAAQRAQEFLRLIKQQIEPHLQARENRDAHYEDIYAATRQFLDDEMGEIVNPLLADALAKIKAASTHLHAGQEYHIDKNPFASLADRAGDLMQSAVYYGYRQASGECCVHGCNRALSRGLKPPLSTKMLAKAQSAMTSAVEVYNRPSFAYREETFAILALNAWELLLKAKVVKDGGNKPQAIWAFDYKTLRSGQRSTKLTVVRNRTGNPMTIGIRGCLHTLEAAGKPLSQDVVSNLDALVAVRDNATHYFAASPALAKKVSEICGATVTNFINIARAWFNADFTKHFSMCIPVVFVSGQVNAVVTGGERRLVDYLDKLIGTQSNSTDFAVAVRLEMKFEKSASPDAVKVQFSKEPDAIKVTLTEEDVMKAFPWTYDELTSRLKARYSNFISNAKYHQERKTISVNPKLARIRLLDPANPKGIKKTYYSPNIVAEFDKLYTLKP